MGARLWDHHVLNRGRRTPLNMMLDPPVTVDDVIQSAIGFGLGTEAAVSGYLVVSDYITYLCASESPQEKAILLVAPWLSIALHDAGVPLYVGSMVKYAGPAIVSGTLARSGLELLPFAFYRVDHVSFGDEEQRIDIQAPDASVKNLQQGTARELP